MSRRRRSSSSSSSHAQPVDLRPLARAFLTGDEPLAMTPSALERVRRIGAADGPVLADPAAFVGDAQRGRNVRGGVAIVPLQGVITPRDSWLSLLFGGGSGGLQGFRRRLRDALGDDEVDSIVLDVHSPGGSVSLVHETAVEVREARGRKPLVAVANTMAASAAYNIASQADELVVTPSGFVGSIGVYIVHTDWSAFNADMGVMPTYVSAGKFKVEGNEDEPLGQEARAALQREVDDFYALFVEDVALGRGVAEAAVRNGYGEGRILTAQRGLEAGLVDAVETIDDVVRTLASGDRPTARAGASSGRPGTVPSGDNRGPNAPQAEEVLARIAELRRLTPSV